MGLTYVYANFAALVLGILFSFKTQSAFVFDNSDNRRILRFAFCWAVIYLTNIAVITLFLRWGMGPYVAGAIALPFIAVFSYFVQKNIVFSTPTDRTP
jgi:putative flippase GtrA